MINRYVERTIHGIPKLEKFSLTLSRFIHKKVMQGGERTRKIADFLHGTWLGHPLHPAMTDVPIGSWTAAVFFDGVAARNRSRETEQMADALTLFGTVAAVPTAIAGVADYSTVRNPAASTATVHAFTNTSALLLYLLSIRGRRRGERGRALFYSTMAYLLVLFGAWLGGHLSYKQRVGVDFTEAPSQPTDWTAVADETSFTEGDRRRIEVNGYPVMLYRHRDNFYAISAVCGHEGGPLDKGEITDTRVKCPWHDSVYDLRDGRNIHGPSVYSQPAFDTRVRDGKVEIRLKERVPQASGMVYQE